MKSACLARLAQLALALLAVAELARAGKSGTASSRAACAPCATLLFSSNLASHACAARPGADAFCDDFQSCLECVSVAYDCAWCVQRAKCFGVTPSGSNQYISNCSSNTEPPFYLFAGGCNGGADQAPAPPNKTLYEATRDKLPWWGWICVFAGIFFCCLAIIIIAIVVMCKRRSANKPVKAKSEAEIAAEKRRKAALSAAAGASTPRASAAAATTPTPTHPTATAAQVSRPRNDSFLEQMVLVPDLRAATMARSPSVTAAASPASLAAPAAVATRLDEIELSLAAAAPAAGPVPAPSLDGPPPLGNAAASNADLMMLLALSSPNQAPKPAQSASSSIQSSDAGSTTSDTSN